MDKIIPKIRPKIWIYCLAVLLLAQCTHTSKLKNVEDRILNNSHNVDSLITQIRSVQSEIQILRSGLKGKSNLLEENISSTDQLRSQIHNLEKTVNTLEQKLKQQNAIILEFATEPIDTIAGTKPEEYPTLENPTAEDFYLRARQYYKDGKYQKSIETFTQILRDFPENDLAQNSQYWIGECYYRLEQYETAMYSFDKVIQNYPFTNKTVDAKLKIALCLIGMKEYQGALTQLKEIRATHPGYHNISLVEEKINLLENQ